MTWKIEFQNLTSHTLIVSPMNGTRYKDEEIVHSPLSSLEPTKSDYLLISSWSTLGSFGPYSWWHSVSIPGGSQNLYIQMTVPVKVLWMGSYPFWQMVCGHSTPSDWGPAKYGDSVIMNFESVKVEASPVSQYSELQVVLTFRDNK